VGAVTDPIATPHFYDRLRARVEGLTDDELTWEPAPGVTTIAWRLAHIADGLAAERNWRWLGREPEARPTPTRATADEAIADIEDAWHRWDALVLPLTETELDAPIGPIGGPFAESSRREFVLHMVDELIHHGAEVALLRDLYAAKP
jgi:uncharacterized damage-inducible protein DinB